MSLCPITVRKIFKFRVHMASFKCNYRGKYEENRDCMMCGQHVDSQEEIKNCKLIAEKLNVNKLLRYEEIYSDRIEADVVDIVEKILKLREDECVDNENV